VHLAHPVYVKPFAKKHVKTDKVDARVLAQLLRMDYLPESYVPGKEIPETVKCLIWIAILTLMCSRKILRLIQNANPENANRYTSLRWAKVFTEQADRLLTEVLECVGLKLGMLTLYSIYLGQGCDPNVNRERLMDRWIT